MAAVTCIMDCSKCPKETQEECTEEMKEYARKRFVEPTEQHLPGAKNAESGWTGMNIIDEQVEAEKNLLNNTANPVCIKLQSMERTFREGQEDLGTYPELLLIRMDNGLNIPYKIAELYASYRYHLINPSVQTEKKNEPELEDPIEPDMVNHPEHYQGAGGMEVINVIEAFADDLYGIEAVCQGNAIKYLLRWFKKNGIEDLDKCIWYINKLKESVLKHEAEGKYSCPCGG